MREIARARSLAGRLAPREGSLDVLRELGELDLLEGQLQELAANSADGPAAELYLAVRRVKRRIAFANPAVDFSQVLFIDQPYPRFPEGKSWPYDRKGGNVCRHGNSHRNGMMATAERSVDRLLMSSLRCFNRL